MKLFKVAVVLVFCIGCLSCKKSIIQPAEAELSISDAYQQSIKNNTGFRIIVLGSSTAAGYGASVPDSNWVNRLQSKFKLDKKSVFITNLAKGGFTSYQIMPDDFTKTDRPDPDTSRNVSRAIDLKANLVIINLPTNDIAYGYSGSEYTSNINAVVSALEKKNINCIVIGTQPRNFKDVAFRNLIKAYNDKLKTYFTRNFVDILDLLSENTYMIKSELSSGDGIHVNDAGHRIIYNSVYNNLFFKEKLP